MNPLQLQVAALPSLVRNNRSQDSGCIVIDSLRFTTSAAQALASNCSSIIVAESISQAQQLAQQDQSQLPVLLCGERNCRPITGFDLGNSPLEYTPQRVQNRQLVFTTTNGTLAVKAAAGYQHCLLGALVNRLAVARKVLELKTNQWQIICAGTDGEIAGEDLLTAGAIVSKLVELTPADVELINDSAILAAQLWNQAIQRSVELPGLLSSFSGGQNLVEAGFMQDISFACQVDSVDVVPIRSFNESSFSG